MILDIKFPPVVSLSAGEQMPMPSDDELDELFAEIGMQIARHPMLSAIRLVLTSISAYALQNSAVIELLIAKSVLDEESREQVHEIVERLNAQSNKLKIRAFVGYAAQGLMKINEKSLSPDDAATLVSMFVDEEPDFGAALSSVTRSVFTPEHLAAFFNKANGSDDPLKTLLDYRMHEDADSRLESLARLVKRLSDTVDASKAESVELAARLEASEERSQARISALEKEVGRLQEEISTFRVSG